MSLKEVFLPWLVICDLKQALASKDRTIEFWTDCAGHWQQRALSQHRLFVGAAKNDHRDPRTGRFVKAPEPKENPASSTTIE